MPGSIDPAKLTGTLKALAEGIAKQEGNPNLIDTGSEILIFQSCAQQLLDAGKAFDYTQEDLNKILGLEISNKDQEIGPVYGIPDIPINKPEPDTLNQNIPSPVYGISDIPVDKPEPDTLNQDIPSPVYGITDIEEE